MKAPPLDGVLVVHKPVGPSSHDVVAVARRSLGLSRIGHTGTLDPQASGVLPLVLGQATRLAQHLTGSDKEYAATVRFGVVTDTYDRTGEVLASSGDVPSIEALETALRRFRGTFAQTPPAYSAKMIGGDRSYVHARAGKPLRSPAVVVTTHIVELLVFEPPLARLRIRCSAGFYVRSLAHDLGEMLATGGILEQLVRTEAAGFGLSEALSFEALVQAPREALRERVLPMESLLTDLPAVWLTMQGVEWAHDGRDLGPAQLTTPRPDAAALVRLFGPDRRLVGLADRSKTPGFLHPTVVFRYN
ncbi:MAG TPA: tRNA pseudouridine(55) synthase TruB [Vicinamibacterales bacterium]|nr:tRNA pseudouridine(55) synthase TruB [Vicinamibacterales bacterium]